jgi:hypothetical protein
VIDGGKAIRTALKATFGERVLIARCRQHKRRNVLDHLPEEQRTFIGAYAGRSVASQAASIRGEHSALAHRGRPEGR